MTAVMPRPLVRERRGSALILVLVAMVVLLVLSSGAMFGSMQELRTSRNASVQQRAQQASEFGLNQQLAQWGTTRNAMANGAIDSTVVAVQTGDTARVRVQRLNARTFNIVSIGRSAIGNGLMEAQRQTSMLVRVSSPSIMPLGLMSIFNNINVQGSPVLDGRNTPPPGWSACSGYPTTDTVALAYNPAAVPTIQKANQTVGGTRATAAAADTSTYSVFGTETWASLIAKANVTTSGGNPSPVGTSTTCVTSSTNWGEPNRSGNPIVGCQNYFPIVYSAGDLSITGGRGQGILLVNGSLTIRGNFVFAGIILVRNNLDVAGTPTLYGSVMVRGANGAASSILGNAEFNFSHCATGQALSGLATPRRTAQRSWTQLY
ncbi:MAG: hypothetical protein K2R93_01305 [Gemmatimonadaceae bacterium]|nr:hypothetical protein [Gemmatimonadaceae bacterium]